LLPAGAVEGVGAWQTQAEKAGGKNAVGETDGQQTGRTSNEGQTFLKTNILGLGGDQKERGDTGKRRELSKQTGSRGRKNMKKCSRSLVGPDKWVKVKNQTKGQEKLAVTDRTVDNETTGQGGLKSEGRRPMG